MDTRERTEVFSLLVVNEANVLARLSSLFGRRGFNIDSFTASPTNNPKLTRITIKCTGNDQKFDQILTQTAKIESVQQISIMNKENSIYRELLLLKIAAGREERAEIREITEIYRGKIVDLSQDSMIVELTGATEKIDGFMKMMDKFEILEVCRTGVTGIDR